MLDSSSPKLDRSEILNSELVIDWTLVIDETQIGSRIHVSSRLSRSTTHWPSHRKFFRKLLRACMAPEITMKPKLLPWYEMMTTSRPNSNGGEVKAWEVALLLLLLSLLLRKCGFSVLCARKRLHETLLTSSRCTHREVQLNWFLHRTPTRRKISRGGQYRWYHIYSGLVGGVLKIERRGLDTRRWR